MDFDAETIADRLRKDEDDQCYLSFAGPDGRLFLAEFGPMSEVTGTYVVCELLQERKVRQCAVFRMDWRGDGRLWRSDDRRFLILATDEPQGDALWTLIDLRDLSSRIAETLVGEHIVDVTLHERSNTCWIATTIAGRPGAVQIRAYRVEGDLSWPARRLLDPPGDISQGGQSLSPDENAGLKLYLTTGGIMLAMEPRTLISLALDRASLWPAWIIRLFEWPWWRNMFAEDIIRTRWTIPNTGFPGSAPTKISRREKSDRIAVWDGQLLRLIQGDDGTFLSPIMDLSTMGDCSGDILSVEISLEDSIHATTKTCSATRAPPMATQDMARIAGSLEAYLPGVGVASH
jgi:hypothetical protein